MVDIEHVRKRLSEGAEIICIAILDGRSTVAKVLSVDTDGNSEYEVLGVCPDAPVYN